MIAGKNKGEKGTIAKVFPETNRIIVEGVNKAKRHIRAKNRNEKGSIVEREIAFHMSNVMLIDPKTSKGTRIGKKVTDGKKVRVAKKSGAEMK